MKLTIVYLYCFVSLLRCYGYYNPKYCQNCFSNIGIFEINHNRLNTVATKIYEPGIGSSNISKPYVKKSENKNITSNYSPIKKQLRSIDNYYDNNKYNSYDLLDFYSIKQLIYATTNGFNQFTLTNLKQFHEKHNFNVKECNILIKQLGDRGYINKIEIVYEFMQLANIKPTVITYNTIISRAGKWKYVDIAEKYFYKMSQSGIQPDTLCYNSLINSYAKSSNSDKALTLFNKMISNNIIPNVETFNILIDLYSRNRQPIKAKEIINNMKIYSIQPNVRSYTSLIHAWCEIDNIEEAKKVLNEMELYNIEPSEITYSILLHALGSSGQLLEAFRMLISMKSKGMQPNVVIKSSLLHACSKFGKLDYAFDIYNEMMQSNDLNARPNSITCSALIDSCLKKSEIDKALSVIKDMKERKMKLTEVTYTSIITELTRLNMIDRILEFTVVDDDSYTLDKIITNNKSYSNYFPNTAKNIQITNPSTNPIIENKVDSKINEKMRNLFNNINKNIINYNKVICDINKILSIILDCIYNNEIPLKYYNKIKDLNNKSIIIINSLSNIEQLIDVQKSFLDQTLHNSPDNNNLNESNDINNTNNNDIDVNFNNEVLNSITITQNIINSKSKLESLISIYNELSKIVESFDYSTNDTINNIKNIFIKHGDYDMIVKEYERIKSLGEFPDVKTYNTIMNSIYTTSIQKSSVQPIINDYKSNKSKQMRNEDLFRLYLVFQEMKYNTGIQLDTPVYNTLISACANVGDIDRAIETMKVMQEDGIEPNVITYTSLIKGCAYINDPPRMVLLAENLFNEMQQRSNHFTKYIEPNAKTYEKLMQVYEYHGYTSKMVSRIYELLEELLQRNMTPTIKIYRYCIQAAIFDNDITKALYILDLIRNDNTIGFDYLIWNQVIKLCEKLNYYNYIDKLNQEINNRTNILINFNE